MTSASDAPSRAQNDPTAHRKAFADRQMHQTSAHRLWSPRLPMKIALATPTFLPSIGGAEFVVHHLACAWSSMGHEVCVLNATTSERPGPDCPYDVRHLRVSRGSSRFGYHRFPFVYGTLHRLRRALRDIRPDAISAHFAYPTATWLAAIHPTPRFVVTCHGSDICTHDWAYRKLFDIDALLRRSINKSTAVIAISAQARLMLQELGVDPARIADIPNGVEVRRFKRRSEWNLRSHFGIADSAFVVLSVGRDHAAKAYDTGLSAFHRALQSTSDMHYVIVGRGVARWAQLASDLGIRSRVHFHDGLYGDELVGAYQQADIYLSCSRSETMPLVVLEAMAAGCAPVVTNVSGSQDLVDHGENGLLAPPDDTETLAAHLSELAESEPLRMQFRRSNLERADSYDWSNIALRYLEYMRL